MLFTQDSDSWVYRILYARSHINSTRTPRGISSLDSPTSRVDSFMLGVSKVVCHRTLTGFLKQVRDLLLSSGNLKQAPQGMELASVSIVLSWLYFLIIIELRPLQALLHTLSRTSPAIFLGKQKFHPKVSGLAPPFAWAVHVKSGGMKGRKDSLPLRLRRSLLGLDWHLLCFLLMTKM